ncbi:MAG: glycosyltransferase family 1 protein [Acidobacteria bacterium]|nr:MAG: glycosyltransferase family 1 protein [Acidobacteriota bacterium]REK01482.1 MAG: glycosyltransferase family 1 protein [Acidobacteriota bacterium]REK14438.1 MAG: glycosyltransferase family 1 protein [Acidobacteriota bacterium]REK45153.1 MAG: glycosyltransferase family 1 protein [Acidobacteriota bacterium]
MCFIGNLIGRNPGFITTQGEILSDLFEKDGFEVVSASSNLNPVIRLFDVLRTIVGNARKIDILIIDVFSGRAFMLAEFASLLGKVFRIPSVLVLRGGNLPEFTEEHRSRVCRVLARADSLVAPSTFLSAEMSPFGMTAEVIPNSIPIDGYSYRHRNVVSPSLIWMRSFHEIYNPHLALDAFALVKKEHREATLVMAGVDKGLEESVKTKADEMGLAESVRFPGFLDLSGKNEEFSKADIYLNTNRIDNMPVSVVEACAMGLPVVATNVGGLPYLLTHGETGLLVDSEDAEQMADAVLQLLSDPDLSERLSRNGRKLAERSSWKQVRKDWEHLFDRILDRKGLTESESSGKALVGDRR